MSSLRRSLTLLFVAAVCLALAPRVPDQDRSWQTPVIRSGSAQVRDPNDPNKTVTATAEYFIVLTTSAEKTDDPPIQVREVKVRPESPAQPFTMRSVRTRMYDDEDYEDDMESVYYAVRRILPMGASSLLDESEARAQAQLDDYFSGETQVNPNENLQPGGWTVRKYGQQKYVGLATYQLMRRITVPGLPPNVQPVWTRTVPMAEYLKPVPLIDEKFYPDPQPGAKDQTGMIPGYGGLQFTPDYAEKFNRSGINLPTYEYSFSSGNAKDFKPSIRVDSYFADISKSLRTTSVDQLVALSGLSKPDVNRMLLGAAAQGNSMNQLSFPGDPKGLGDVQCGSTANIPAGTLWIPDQPGYQAMSSVTGLNYRFNSFVAGIEPAAFQDQANFRTHCLNMNLKEPAPGVRYFPYVPSDPVIGELSRIAEKANFKGPWDQARTWIYTDRATIAEINERLLPPVSPSHYTNGVWDVVRVGGFREQDLKNKAIFIPELILCPSARDDAQKWMIAHLTKEHGQAVGKYLAGAPDEAKKMVTAPANQFERDFMPMMLRSVLRSGSLPARTGALRFIEKLGPDAAALKGKVGSFARSLGSRDKAEADLATKLAPQLATEIDAGSDPLPDIED